MGNTVGNTMGNVAGSSYLKGSSPLFGRNWTVVGKDDPTRGTNLKATGTELNREQVKTRVDAAAIHRALFDTYRHIQKLALDELRTGNEETRHVSMIDQPDGYTLALTGSDNTLYRALGLLVNCIQRLGESDTKGYMPNALRHRSFSKGQKRELVATLTAARNEIVAHPDRRLLTIEI